MLRELKQGLVFTVVTMALLGGGYNVLLLGIGRWCSRRSPREA